MNNKYVYLAWDIDGTIYDAGDILEEAFSLGIEKYIDVNRGQSIQKPTRYAITTTLGLPLKEIFLILFPDSDDLTRDELSSACTEYLVKMIREKKGKLIEDVFNIIAELHNQGYKMLVASNGVRAYVEAILETYNLKQFFSDPFIYPEGDITNKTGIIAHYLSVLTDYKEIIMIGDRYTDLEAALVNNIPFIGCAFGHAGADEIEGQENIVHNFKEIPEVLKTI